ncbi:MAG: HWE histidine kinase domain-containing protein [Caulobacterales bacterium]
MPDTPTLAPGAPPTDLTNCDREPIHIPGAIQSHGCLIACDESLKTILRASQNAASFLGQQGVQLVGQKLDAVLGERAAHDIRNCAAGSAAPSTPGLLFNFIFDESRAAFDLAAHRYKGNTIIEFERSPAQKRGTPLDLVRTLVGAVTACKDTKTLLQRTPRLLSSALGYDRVMIYQFSHDGAGKVVSEVKRSDLEGFLGQYFPGSDIPQQARRLYLENTIRVISDSSGARETIAPVLDASGEPLDLSFAHLRSVSPIHLEYLRNMGVSASMSISIVVDGALWGLIACHHYSPKTLSMARRAAAEMLGQFFSLQLEALLKKASLESAARARRALDRVMREVAYRGDIAESLRDKLPDFASFMQSDGVGLWIGGIWTGQGAAPPTREIAPLMRFLRDAADGRIWATHELSAHLPAARRYCADAAGLLAIPLSQIPGDYLVFFRREVVQSLDWAGDPNKTYEAGPLGDRLTPRKSFAIWKEMVERQSIPWSEGDRDMAGAARTALLEVIMRHSEILESERQTADVRQKLLNEELNHRVKNILSLIKSLVAQPLEDGRSLEDYVQALKGRIMALAYAHDQVIRSDGGGSLNTLLSAELSPYCGENCHIEGPSLNLDSRAFSVLALVFHELATNAAKYGALSSEAGKLSVTWRVAEDGALHVNWIESGGPPVTPPRRTGFGSVLLNRSIPFDLGGASDIAFDRDGLKARLRIPARFVGASAAAESGHAKQQSKAAAAGDTLQGRKVLLLEDQLVIAIDIETMLSDLGAAHIDTAATAAEALRIIAASRPDVCVLDINLGAGTSFAVADELKKRAIPFVFATGYGDQTSVLSEAENVPVVRKPYTIDALADALKQALDKA